MMMGTLWTAEDVGRYHQGNKADFADEEDQRL